MLPHGVSEGATLAGEDRHAAPDASRELFQYQLMLSKDGSGIGAAVVAAVATRIKREMTSRSEKTA